MTQLAFFSAVDGNVDVLRGFRNAGNLLDNKPVHWHGSTPRHLEIHAKMLADRLFQQERGRQKGEL